MYASRVRPTKNWNSSVPRNSAPRPAPAPCQPRRATTPKASRGPGMLRAGRRDQNIQEDKVTRPRHEDLIAEEATWTAAARRMRRMHGPPSGKLRHCRRPGRRRRTVPPATQQNADTPAPRTGGGAAPAHSARARRTSPRMNRRWKRCRSAIAPAAPGPPRSRPGGAGGGGRRRRWWAAREWRGRGGRGGGVAADELMRADSETGREEAETPRPRHLGPPECGLPRTCPVHAPGSVPRRASTTHGSVTAVAVYYQGWRCTTRGGCSRGPGRGGCVLDVLAGSCPGRCVAGGARTCRACGACWGGHVPACPARRGGCTAEAWGACPVRKHPGFRPAQYMWP